MTPVPEHDHTTQEQTIWDHMEAGEWEQIEAIEDAIDKKKTPDDDKQKDKQQFKEDQRNAHHHYQDSHETPEPEREANTKAQAKAENTAAAGVQEGL